MKHRPLHIAAACLLSAMMTWLVSLGGSAQVQAHAETRKATAVIRLQVPAAIAREHAELLERLTDARRAGGRTGPAAERVAKLLLPHFEKEEQYALPPLAMLRPFAGGDTPANAEELLAVTERFRAEYPAMLEEHQAIVAALDELRAAAKAEKNQEVLEFAEELERHAEMEEEILYPTTVLIGEYLKLALAK